MATQGRGGGFRRSDHEPDFMRQTRFSALCFLHIRFPPLHLPPLAPPTHSPGQVVACWSHPAELTCLLLFACLVGDLEAESLKDTMHPPGPITRFCVLCRDLLISGLWEDVFLFGVLSHVWTEPLSIQPFVDVQKL